MEFFDLGKHCHYCRQQDFLPFHCEFCKHSFCSEHRYANHHECKNYTSKVQNQKEKHPTSINTTKFNTCHHKRCQEFTVTTCKQCTHSFCSNHRLTENHECKEKKNTNNSTSRVFDITKIKDFQLRKAIESEVKGKKIREEFGFKRTYEIKQDPKKRKKNEALSFSNTIDFSFGNQNIEEEDRLYFKIFFPKESQLQPVHWFFSKSRSIGKVIDLIAQKGKIKSKITSIEDPSRLNIFKFSTGNPLKASKTLKELEKEGMIKDGEVLIVERAILGEMLNVKDKFGELFGTSKFEVKDSFNQTSSPKGNPISVYL
eukprot:gene10852-3472_t